MTRKPRKPIIKGGFTNHGLVPDDDPRYGEPRKGKRVFRGFLPDDDAIYQDGGFLWPFIMGKGLSPNIKPKKEKASERRNLGPNLDPNSSVLAETQRH